MTKETDFIRVTVSRQETKKPVIREIKVVHQETKEPVFQEVTVVYPEGYEYKSWVTAKHQILIGGKLRSY